MSAVEPGKRPGLPLLSVICPVFNEEACIPLFHERLRKALDGIDATYEVIFMNNRSTDGTVAAVLALREKDTRVQLVTLSKNVGYQGSVQAGLRQAAGDVIVVIDVDCEDPPEMIPQFLDAWRQGHDLVFGERKRRDEPFWITMCRKVFYRLNRLLADSDIILDMAEFCLMTAEVRDAVCANHSTFPFVRAEIAAAGFSRKGIAYDRQPRVAGTTHYNLLRMTTFAVAGILSSTTFPLRAALYALAVVVPVDVAWLISRALRQVWFGFQPTVVMNLLYLAVVGACLSLYLARTYRNAVGRPIAVVDWGASATNHAPRDSGNLLPSRGTRRTSST